LKGCRLPFTCNTSPTSWCRDRVAPPHIDDHASFVVYRAASVRPRHLFDQNVDRPSAHRAPAAPHSLPRDDGVRLASSDRGISWIWKHGSLDLYIQYQRPGTDKEANWLPSSVNVAARNSSPERSERMKGCSGRYYGSCGCMERPTDSSNTSLHSSVGV